MRVLAGFDRQHTQAVSDGEAIHIVLRAYNSISGLTLHLKQASGEQVLPLPSNRRTVHCYEKRPDS